MLEKMKQGVGDILYASHFPYLVQNAHQLYYAHDYQNELQEQVYFLSFREYLETITVPQGREVNRNDFEIWFNRQSIKNQAIKDAHKLFEEFKGVLTGPAIDSPYLSREDYQTLGVRQSLYSDEVRGAVYDLFEKYLDWLKISKLYDSNIISQQYLGKVTPQYDFVVVDEVQDITNIQLLLLLKSLRQAGEFILCGDANQIVHPNFFSWSKLKSLFFEQEKLTSAQKALHILHANYRNSPLVTHVANRILKLKHARFGSVDKESNYLVESVGQQQGALQLLENTPKVINQLDASTAIVEAIARRGADKSLVANNGLNAWQLALAQGLKDDKSAKKLAHMHEYLAPDAIAVQVGGKLERFTSSIEFGRFWLSS